MPEDSLLLHRYVDEKSEEAFAKLVRRHVDLVHAVALRKVGGDVHLANDVVQQVFTALAAKAGSLRKHPALTGWLFTSTHYAATQLVRSEGRRRVREQKARDMDKSLNDSGQVPDWEQLRPMLDDVIHGLGDRDRTAVLLRFFENRPFAEVGERLRLSEEGARSRVDRALGKMQAMLARRGITSTSAALATALAGQVSAAAPAGLATSITGMALAGMAATSGTAVGAAGWTAIFMSMSKLQFSIAAIVGLAGVAGYMSQAKTNADLRREIDGLQGQRQEIGTLRTENRRLADAVREVEMLRRDDAELKQLAESAAEIKRTNEGSARLARIQDEQRKIQAEIARMNGEGNALVGEYRTLVEQSKEPLLTTEAKAEAMALAQQKMEAIKVKMSEITLFKANARAAGLLPPEPAPTTGWRLPPEGVTPSGIIQAVRPAVQGNDKPDGSARSADDKPDSAH